MLLGGSWGLCWAEELPGQLLIARRPSSWRQYRGSSAWYSLFGPLWALVVGRALGRCVCSLAEMEVGVIRRGKSGPRQSRPWLVSAVVGKTESRRRNRTSKGRT